MPARIFYVNEYEWWIGDCKPEQVLAAYLKTSDETREEYLDYFGEPPRPLSDRHYHDDEEKVTRTFREQLAMEAAEGVPEPRPFANTEG